MQAVFGAASQAVAALMPSGYRRALVTGAGLGVIALARNAADLDALATPTGCTTLALDLADTAAIHRALAGLEIDVPVNDAGLVTAVRPLHETDIHLETTGGDRARMEAAPYAKVEALRPADVAAAIGAALDLPEGADAASVELFPTGSAPVGAVFADRG